MSDGTISGRVTIVSEESGNEGEPFKDIVAGAVFIDTGEICRMEAPDASGQFEMSSMDLGKYRIIAMRIGPQSGACPGTEVNLSEESTVIEDVSVELTL